MNNVLIVTLIHKTNGVVKMPIQNPSEENRYDDFFSRFDFVNYQDKMGEFTEK